MPAPTPSKAADPDKRPNRLKGWDLAVDGSKASHRFDLPSADEAAQFARRALHLAHKAGEAIELRLDGAAVSVRFSAQDGLVPQPTRALAHKLLPKSEEEKAKHAAFREEKVRQGLLPPKPAKPSKA